MKRVLCHQSRQSFNLLTMCFVQDGFIPTENLRFRDEALVFKVSESATEEIKRFSRYEYPNMSKTLGSFQ